jgi:hypothetical protein
MAERLEDLFRACTVRVTGGPEPSAGLTIGWDGEDPPLEARVSGVARLSQDLALLDVSGLG